MYFIHSNKGENHLIQGLKEIVFIKKKKFFFKGKKKKKNCDSKYPPFFFVYIKNGKKNSYQNSFFMK